MVFPEKDVVDGVTYFHRLTEEIFVRPADLRILTIDDKLIEPKRYIDMNCENLPEIRNWTRGDPR